MRVDHSTEDFLLLCSSAGDKVNVINSADENWWEVRQSGSCFITSYNSYRVSYNSYKVTYSFWALKRVHTHWFLCAWGMCGLQLISNFCWNFFLFVSAFARTFLQCTYKRTTVNGLRLGLSLTALPVYFSNVTFQQEFFSQLLIFELARGRNLVVNNKDNRVFMHV